MKIFFLSSPDLGSSWGSVWTCLVSLTGWQAGRQLNSSPLQAQPFSLCCCQCSLSVAALSSLHLTFAVPLLQAFYDLSLCFPFSQEWQERTPACVQPVGGRQSRRPLGLVLRPAAATATHAQSNQACFLQKFPWAHDIPAICNRVSMSRACKLGLESSASLKPVLSLSVLSLRPHPSPLPQVSPF